MDSSSRRTLHQLFISITSWRKELRFINTIAWTESHLSIVYCYILKLGDISSEFNLLKSAKKLPFGEHLYPRVRFSREMVASFTQELQEVFVVPKLYQLDVSKKIELLAAFINFLLQLLSHERDIFEDQMEVVNKGLRFLVTVLGDTSLLLVAELERVQNLLAEFEAVANEAGHLVYSFVFNIDELYKTLRVHNALVALLKNVDHLTDNISNFSFLVRDARGAKTFPKIGAAHSCFIVDSLLEDLEDLMNWENDQIVDIKGQIKFLHGGLRNIKVPRHTEIRGLEEIMMRIGNVAYEAEYLINSFLVGDAPQWYLTIRLPDVINKVNLMGTKLKEIKNNDDSTGAFEVAKDLSAEQAERNSEGDDITVGLEDEATGILDQLVGGTKHLKIISIFGMPGLGKTTLAKKLYNHPSVNYHFDRRLWCIVSQSYQMITVLTDILMSLGNGLDYKEETLGEQIHKSLKGRRYLIVLDDIWSSNVWDDLLRHLPDDGNGSRILYTSRYKDVAPQDSIIHGLPLLSNDQCWKLLEKKVFGDKCCPPLLLRIGRKIAEDCNGLPLAVVVIAGILSTMDKEESTWEKVGGSLASHIFSDQTKSVMRILKLSYNHLPHHLRPCFLYFGAFPEDKEIPVNKLKYLWMAEGFICREENKHKESVAEEYLKELIDRSLVIVAKRRSDGGAKSCVVHDLLRDLCLRIAEEENFLKWMGNNNSIYTKYRRLCFNNMKFDQLAPREYFLPFGHHIRSFFPFVVESPQHVLNMDFTTYRSVKGDGIRAPVLTRYLAATVTRMPESIGRFANLEFLIVNAEGDSLFIPPVILKLVKLTHLHITPQARFDKDCYENLQMNNLQSFFTIQVRNQWDEEILKCSPNLRKLKCKCEQFVEELDPCCRLDLHFLTQLESLKVITSSYYYKPGFRPSASGNPSAAGINLPLNIRKLTLSCICWLREQMSIIGGLPNLEVLKLEYADSVEERWDTGDGEFQKLRILKIYESNLVEWNVASSEHFPKLQQLILHGCRYLREIPCEIGEIETLQLIEVKSGKQSLRESAIRIREERRDIGHEEPRVIILGHTHWQQDMFDDDISSSSEL